MLSITTVPPVSEHHALSLTRDEFAVLSPVEQLRRAFGPGHRLGAVIGALIGGFVPVASYEIVHAEILANKWLWALVGGALLFSALSVFGWAEAAFHSGLKAAGFCVLAEGTMVLTRNQWLGLSALGLLVLINVCSCSCALQVRPDSIVTSDTGIQSLGLHSPSVTVNVQALQQNAVTPAPRQHTRRPSRSKDDAERKAEAARRAREYRKRRRDAQASQLA